MVQVANLHQQWIKTAFFSVIILFAVTGMAQKSAQDMNLQGNVRRLFTHKHQAKDIVIENNTIVSYEKVKLLNHVDYIFEKNGALLAENNFNKEDLIDISYIYEYDEAGRLIDLTIARAGKILIGRVEYKYDKDGKKTQEIEFDNADSLKSTTVFRYDSLGNLVNEKLYNKTNRLGKDIHYQHDERGNVVFVNNLKLTAASKPYQEIQRFDDRNNLIYKSFTRNDTLKWEYFASYNKSDSLIYEEVKNGEGKQEAYSKLTFKNDRRISLEQYNYDADVQKFETYYEYDKSGKLFTEKLYTANKKMLVTVRTYFYDEKGNWIYCLEEDKINKTSNVSSRRFNYF